MSLIGKNLILFVCRNWFVNTYLLLKDNHCVVIDPSLNDKQIIQYVKDNKLIFDGIILTHGHYDHVGNSFLLAKETNCKIYVYAKEKEVLEKYSYANDMHGELVVDKNYVEYFSNSSLKINDFNFQVYHLPGHTEGSVVIKYENYVFVGDLIFKDTIGRTDLNTGNQIQMDESLNKVLTLFKDDDLILPGHGIYVKFKDVKESNQFLKH